jgi:hypothetical protein
VRPWCGHSGASRGQGRSNLKSHRKRIRRELTDLAECGKLAGVHVGAILPSRPANIGYDAHRHRKPCHTGHGVKPFAEKGSLSITRLVQQCPPQR